MDEKIIKALGEAISKTLIGIAALVGAYKTPEAISNFAVNLKTEQIVNNTIKNINSIVNSVKNENHNEVHISFKEKLQSSLNNPAIFKNNIATVPTSVLKELGLQQSKEDLLSSLEKAKTSEEIKVVVKKQLPNLLFDNYGKPFKLDESRLGP